MALRTRLARTAGHRPAAPLRRRRLALPADDHQRLRRLHPGHSRDGEHRPAQRQPLGRHRPCAGRPRVQAGRRQPAAYRGLPVAGQLRPVQPRHAGRHPGPLVPPRPAPGRRLHHHQPGRRQPVLAGGLERPLPRLLRRQRRHRLLPRRQRFAQLRASPGQRDQSRHRADFPAGLRLQYQPAAPLARLRQRQPLAAEPAGTVLQGLAAGPPVARRRYLARHRAAAGRYQPGREGFDVTWHTNYDFFPIAPTRAPKTCRPTG